MTEDHVHVCLSGHSWTTVNKGLPEGGSIGPAAYGAWAALREENARLAAALAKGGCRRTFAVTSTVGGGSECGGDTLAKPVPTLR